MKTSVKIIKSKSEGKQFWRIEFGIGVQYFRIEETEIECKEDKEHVKFIAKMLRLALNSLKNGRLHR